MITLLLAMLVSAPSLEKAFDHYEAGRYEEALEVFAAHAASSDASSAAVLYNMGNCAYRLDRLPEAVLYYRRALLRKPGDEEIRFNLQLTERRLGLETERSSWLARVSAWLDGWPPGLRPLAAVALQSIGLLAWVLLPGRPFRRLTAILLVLLGLTAGAHAVREGLAPGPAAGVVLEEATIRAEPHADLPASFELRPGETLYVLELSDRWLRIEREGREGWVERAAVGIVD